MIQKSDSRRRPSVRTRLAVLVIASVSVAVAIVTAVTAMREGRREAARQMEQFRAAAAVLASTSAEATAERSASRAYASLRAIKLLPGVDYARVETADGRTLAETGSGARLARDVSVSGEAGASTASLLSSGTVEVRAPVTFGRRPVGQVVLLGRTSGVGERLAGALLVSLLAGLAAALVGMLVAWRMQRRITGPILALKDSMAGVRSTLDYSRPAQAPGADAEIAELVEGFNAMLAEIRDRDAAIAGHVEGLERTVAERTADLVVAKEAAENANAAKGDFLATMSHEIRTPMNGIMVMAEMLAAGELPARQRRFAEVIAKSGSSLLAIINDILDFSKIEAGKMELEAAPTDPAEVVEDVASLFWERARSKGLDLAVFVDPAVPARVLADPTRLRQVVGNLVNNAIKFTEAGGVMVTVEAADGGLKFMVRDSGIGIAPEKIGGLFGAFTQADQSITRRFGGTGLGLAICKRLVEAMGGEIQVQSQVGRGSVFGFTLSLETIEAAPEWPRLEGQAALALAGPCTAAVARRYLVAAGLEPAGLDARGAVVAIGEPALLEGAARCEAPTLVLGEYGDGRPAALVRQGQAEAVLIQPLRRGDLLRALRQIAAGEAVTDPGESGGEVATTLPSFVGRRVLVVDDSAVNREVAVEALSRLGVVCETAEDGRQGVAATLAGGFDLVLMDGSMPEMDGYEAAREIRARETAGRTPIVALTAHVVGTAAEAWREAGMDGVLHKPFTLAGLAAVLGQHMEASAERVVEAPSVAAGPTSELLDPEVVGELAGMAAAGKADFVERVRRLYRENAPLAVDAYLDAAAAGDPDGGARAAHALKSMSLNIGARAVAQTAGRLESRARDQGQVTVADGEALKGLLAATLEVLEDRAPARKEPPSLSAEDAALTLALAKAVERDEFHLAYQPQFSRDGQEVTGCEALLRWTHPTQGPIGPNRFIPLAERAGLMGPITRWVLRRAMEETADLDGLAVSVNASALDVADPSFVDDLSAILVRLAFPPKRLEVELTETAVLADEAEAKRAIERLQTLGVSVALDDFGMGYTSLNQLRLYPFDKLKIDRSFIIGCPADTTSATLVHAVISVGRALGMKVVAEGVETEEQRKFLAVAGVHAFQGYLFAKPMPIGEMRALWAGRLAKTG
ncbi:EAL domain-containing protein [Caulobacter sp. SLTY]|uniref:EAL domain-containing protein n=1 Tax=Caulobacter sp. SLTY TaxID=2683262 RepID=UPI0014120620|nr:EAL domain-containing protein [Caulobacter sp. SLTY]NBB16859.1 EAL domain-containing protein [Caulobacter sp. SLTY]